MLSCLLRSLYRHRFSHREKWPAFQSRRLQRWYIPKKQKDRKLQNFIESCSYSKQAVGRYVSLRVLGKYKGTLWLCSSSWILRKDQVAVPGCCLSAFMSLFSLLSRWLWRVARKIPCTGVERMVSHPELSIFVPLICLIFVRQTEKASWFASVVF